MLHVQDPAQGPAFQGPVGASSPSSSSSSSLLNRKHDKDSNFNFLPGKSGGTGDENRNHHHQTRPRNLSPLGRDHQSSGPGAPPPPSSHHHHHLLSPLSRLPCWSPLEPLPEVESGEDSCGRVPPDGAEERRTTPETGSPRGPAPEDAVAMMMMMKNMNRKNNEKERGTRASLEFRGRQEDEEEEEEEDDDEDEEERVRELEDDEEWGDSESDFELSYRSGGSLSSLNVQSGEEGALVAPWERMAVGHPRAPPPSRNPALNDHPPASSLRTTAERGVAPGGKYHPHHDHDDKEPPGAPRSVPAGSRALRGGAGATGRHFVEEEEDEDDDNEEEEEEGPERNQSSDSDGDLLTDAVWTLRDRERFKAQEMEKHQVQLTMYRRLALIRWVRTLQSHVQDQQDRLQSSFDVILTHRKELLRMGAAAGVATPPAAAAAATAIVVGQS